MYSIKYQINMSILINRSNYIEQLEKLKDEHIIKVVTGLRRSGKSTLFEIFAGQIIYSGVSAKRVQQYNFEKPIFLENEFSINRTIDGSKIEKLGFNYQYFDAFNF